jgi:tetratricopeptide (TPR) repeat protein
MSPGLSSTKIIPALLLAVILFPATSLQAQDTDEGFDAIQFNSQRLCFGMSGITQERALAICDALALGQNVRARELAQQWVSDEPEQPGAQFALAEVLFRVEGNLPRALYHLNIAESLTNYGSLGRAMASGNLEWHYLTLSQLSYAHQLIGDQEKSLEYLDRISTIYGQDTESFRGWPLIKMKRYDEARASAEKVLAASANPRDRSRAWNTLCAVELADLRPAESLQACENAMNEDENIAASQSEELDTVHLLNASEVSLNLLRFEEAEDYLNRASRQIDPDSVGNPWIYKLYLYMNQGRFDAARDALDNMLVWRDNQSPLVGVMNRADHFMVSAIFLMLAGYPDDAARLTQTALNQPDRTGSYTADEAQKDSFAALVNSVAHRMRYERMREELATRPRLGAWRLRIDALAARFRAWRSARHAASLFADAETLSNRLRPYAPLDVHIPEWLEPELIALIGPGVMSQLLNNTANEGAFALNQGYVFAYQTEIAALQGQHTEVMAMAEQALAQLPAQEAMLRARVSARLASAAWRAGQRQQALDHYAAALRQDPTILRRLDLPLPITPGGANNDTGAELVSYLNRSPRFTLVEQGLPLEILTTDTPSLCLRDSAGDALSCVELQANDRLADGVAVVDTDDSNAQRLARQFHDRTFSLAYTIDRSQRVALLGNSVIFSNQNASQQQRQDAVLQR